MDETDAGTVVDGEDKRKHLELVQAVVTRMAAASSSSKAWLLPVVTASFGFAVTGRSGAVASLGLLAVVLFSFVDANYLRQERAYRRLYNAVAFGDQRVRPYSLNPGEIDDPVPDASAASRTQRATSIVGTWVPGWRVWLSWSIAPFYGALLIAGALVLAYAIR